MVGPLPDLHSRGARQTGDCHAHPRLRARLNTQAAATYAAGADDAFEFGLQVLLDGLERQVADRSR
jgi:hypothetical protein